MQNISRFIATGLFSLSFILLLSGITFIYYSPKTVVALIEKFIPSEEEVTPLTIKGVGIIGDSLSDEYRGDDSRGLTYASTTLNWVEQLQRFRNVNFGQWDSWGEPRRTGYEYNWSRTGATVNSMFISGQVKGVAEQVKKGKINVVIIYIGANDFAPYITPDGYDAIYNGSISDEDLLRKKNRLVADITTAVEIIRNAGKVKILLITIPDWSNHLGIRAAFPLPSERERVSNLIHATNTDLEQMAAERGVATVDPNIFYQDLYAKGSDEIILEGKRFNAILPSNDPHSVFLDDGVHAGTILNGLFANYIIKAVNTKLGVSLRPFSAKEIIMHAGL